MKNPAQTRSKGGAKGCVRLRAIAAHDTRVSFIALRYTFNSFFCTVDNPDLTRPCGYPFPLKVGEPVKSVFVLDFETEIEASEADNDINRTAHLVDFASDLLQSLNDVCLVRISTVSHLGSCGVSAS